MIDLTSIAKFCGWIILNTYKRMKLKGLNMNKAKGACHLLRNKGREEWAETEGSIVLF